MKVYVIAPVQDLEPMKMGDRIFVLAHLWLKYPQYREFIKARQRDGYFITLDNSAAERSLVTEESLIAICHELIPNEVIAPDILFDKDKTIKNAESFHNKLQEAELADAVNVFFCPQGKTKDEWLAAYTWALEQEWVKVIGLSKIAVPRAWLGSIIDDQGIKRARNICYDYLEKHGLIQKPIHCLGQGDPTEFLHYTNPLMRSTDSVYPYYAASLGQDFRFDSETRRATPHNYLELPITTPANRELLRSNISFLTACCKVSEIFYDQTLK